MVEHTVRCIYILLYLAISNQFFNRYQINAQIKLLAREEMYINEKYYQNWVHVIP